MSPGTLAPAAAVLRALADALEAGTITPDLLDPDLLDDAGAIGGDDATWPTLLPPAAAARPPARARTAAHDLDPDVTPADHQALAHQHATWARAAARSDARSGAARVKAELARARR